MTTLTLSTAGAVFIARFEGFSAAPYRCPADHPTVGFGHRILPHEAFPKPITQAEALTLLQQDAQRESLPVSRALTRELMPYEQDALISLAFNCGGNAIARSTLIRKINAGQPVLAAEEFLRWNKIERTVSRGLTRRRQAERTLFLTGDYGSAS